MKAFYSISFLFLICLFVCCNQTTNKVNDNKRFTFEELIDVYKYKQKVYEIEEVTDSLLNQQQQEYKKIHYFAAAKFYSIEQYNYATKHLQFALNSDHKTSDKTTEANIYYLAGMLSLEENENYQAIYNLNKAGDILYKNKIFNTFPKKSDLLLVQIAFQNIEMNFFNSGMKYISYAEKMNREFNVEGNTTITQIYTIKASLFSKREYLNKDSIDYYIALANLDESYNFFYLKAEFFYNSQQLDSAEYYLNKILEIDDSYSVLAYINLLSVQVDKNQLDKAENIISVIQEKSKETPLSVLDSIVYLENITDYYIVTNQANEAKQSLQKYTELKERMFNVENSKYVHELSALLDIESKEKQIDSINQQAKQISFTLEKRNQVLVICILIILIIAILYTLARFKAKNKQLEFQHSKVKLISANQQLEIKLLKNQMNPHFIFNSLATIQSKIRQRDNENALIYLNEFSQLMRLILETTRKKYSSLQDEIDFIERYMKLQQLRKGSFEYHIDISQAIREDIDVIPFPTFSLQPFIENSILHGFKDSNKTGKIEIKIRSEANYLIIEITDNGVGLSEKEKSHSSQAISMIKERIELFDKQLATNSEIRIENRKDYSGAYVFLKISILETL